MFYHLRKKSRKRRRRPNFRNLVYRCRWVYRWRGCRRRPDRPPKAANTVCAYLPVRGLYSNMLCRCKALAWLHQTHLHARPKSKISASATPRREYANPIPQEVSRPPPPGSSAGTTWSLGATRRSGRAGLLPPPVSTSSSCSPDQVSHILWMLLHYATEGEGRAVVPVAAKHVYSLVSVPQP